MDLIWKEIRKVATIKLKSSIKGCILSMLRLLSMDGIMCKSIVGNNDSQKCFFFIYHCYNLSNDAVCLNE